MHEKSTKASIKHPDSCLWSASVETSRKHGCGWFPVVVSMFINLVAFVLIFKSDAGRWTSATSHADARRLLRLGAPPALNASSYVKKTLLNTTPAPSVAAKWAEHKGVDAMWTNSILFEYLPPLPDIYGIGQMLEVLVVQRRLPSHEEWLCEPPDFFFPDFRTLDDDVKDLHFRYYLSAICFSFWVYSFLGWTLTLWRNSRCEKVKEQGEISRDMENQYSLLSTQSRDSRELGESNITENNSNQIQSGTETSSNQFQSCLVSRYFIFCIIFSWFSLYYYAIPLLVRKGCITRAYAFAGEAWLIYLNLHCVFGLLEVGLSTNQPEKPLPWKVYPDKMFKNLLPVASEKGDTVKDFMVAALAANEDDEVLQALGNGCFILLFVVHVYFVYDNSTRATMFEAYLPILFAEPEKEQDPKKVESYRDWSKKQMAKWLLKQSGKAKRRIAIIEDFPQALANLFFQVWQERDAFQKDIGAAAQTLLVQLWRDMQFWHKRKKGSKKSLGFVAFSLFMSVLKIIVCQLLARILKDTLQTYMLSERDKAVNSTNYNKAVDLQKLIWELADPEHHKTPIFKNKKVEIGLLISLEITFKDLREKLEYGGELSHYIELKKHFNDKESEKDIKALHDAGFTDLPKFKDANFSIQALHAMFSALEFRGVGYTAGELKNAVLVSKLIEGGYTIQELKEAKPIAFNAGDFKSDKYSAADLFQKGFFKVDELKGYFNLVEILKEKIIPILEVKKGGFNAKDFKTEAGYTSGDLFKTGCFKVEEFKNDFELTEILKDGIPVKDVKAGGFTAKEFKYQAQYTAGALFATECFKVVEFKDFFSLNEILKDGIPVKDVKDGGFTVDDFKDKAKYTAPRLYETGCFTASELIGPFELKEILADGTIPMNEVKAAGVTAKMLKDKADYTAFALWASGCFKVSEFKDLETNKEIFSLQEILHVHPQGQIPAKDVADAGYTARQFKEVAGWNTRQLYDANCFEEQDIIILEKNVDQLRAAKIPLQHLKKNGLSVQRLKNEGGFTAAELEEVFDDKELKEAKFSLRELKLSNFDIVRLKKKFGFTFKELIAEGFDSAHIKNRFIVKDLLDDRIALDQILELGFNSPEDFSDFKVKKAPGVAAHIGPDKQDIPETEGTIEIIKVEKGKAQVALFINFGDASNSYWKASTSQVLLKHIATGNTYLDK